MRKKQYLSLWLLTLLCLPASADSLYPADATVEVGGVWYDVVVPGLTASVTHGTDKYAGSVTIASTIDYDGRTFRVTEIGESAFEGCTGLKSISLPATVTVIGEKAFKGCSGLEEAVLPQSLTDIGNEAFRECSSLASVDLPNSLHFIGEYAFQGCSSLSSICLPSFLYGLSKGAFADCTSLKDLLFSRAYAVQQVMIGEEAFARCTSLECVMIPWVAREIGSKAFADCSSLKKIYLGGIYENSRNKLSIVLKKEAFLNCLEISDVYLLYKGDDVISIPSDAFQGCYIEHATLHISNIYEPAYTDIFDMDHRAELLPTDMPTICATPVVSYKDGKLNISCATEGARLYYSVTGKSSESLPYNDRNFGPMELQRQYEITAWAAGGNADLPSETVAATISWNDNSQIDIQGLQNP